MPDQTPSAHAQIVDLLKLVTPEGQPNINELWMALRDIDAVRLNIKNFGYEIAKRLSESTLALQPILNQATFVGLVSKATTQADVESPWFRYWCSELKILPIYHRKLWEFAFLLQTLHEHGMLSAGKRGLGFGCGEEPIASYLASKGVHATVSDLSPSSAAGRGWIETGQHASSLERAYHSDIVSREVFGELVSHEYIDMNAIPARSSLADFCWSICAMEHLGSIEHGLRFVEKSLETVKPGGIAVHTTEFNYTQTDKTIERWETVLFLRKHFEALKSRLEASGHEMLGPNFDVGDGILDRFIDLPPYMPGEGALLPEQWKALPNQNVDQLAHLKLSIDGFPCTCFGLIVKRSAS